MFTRAAVALSLVVRLYDAYGLPAADLAQARTTASAVLRDAGIAVAWAGCPCEDRVGPAELVVRVTAASPSSASNSLGFSYVDRRRRSGTLATVFGDRITALAALADTNRGELLGHAIAHEIGHLLLGTVDHERQGLMRGQWTAIDLIRNQPWDWAISAATADRMRRAIVIRSRQAATPAAVMADKGSRRRDAARDN